MPVRLAYCFKILLYLKRSGEIIIFHPDCYTEMEITKNKKPLARLLAKVSRLLTRGFFLLRFKKIIWLVSIFYGFLVVLIVFHHCFV
jgi:hypothetical protein